MTTLTTPPFAAQEYFAVHHFIFACRWLVISLSKSYSNAN